MYKCLLLLVLLNTTSVKNPGYFKSYCSPRRQKDSASWHKGQTSYLLTGNEGEYHSFSRKSKAKACLSSRNPHPHLSPEPFVPDCFLLPEREEKTVQALSATKQGVHSFLRHSAFTQSLYSVLLLHTIVISPALHLGNGRLKQNSR